MLDPRVHLDLVWPLNSGSWSTGSLDPEGLVLARSEFADLGDVIQIRIDPGPGVRVEDVRIVEVGKAGRVRPHVLPDTELDGGLAGAADVPRHAEARRYVLPVGQVVDRIEVARRDEGSGRHVFR